VCVKTLSITSVSPFGGSRGRNPSENLKRTHNIKTNKK
jgi:hypothetical protein